MQASFKKTTRSSGLRKKAFSTVFLITFTASSLFAQKKNTTTQNQQWLQYYNQIKLAGKWVLLTDVGYRWKNGFEESTQYIARTGVGYSISDHVRVSTGLAHLGFYSLGKINKVEFRPYQELIIKNKLNKVGLSHRYRIEERFFYQVADGEIQTPNSFNFRLRYSCMASIPLFQLSSKRPERTFILNIGDEIFINAGRNVVHNVFDQNRFIVSPTAQMNKDVSISLTWNGQFAATAKPQNYNYTNVFWLQVKQQLDLTGKRVQKEK
ncbi:DUF2490 domain-containing protein [Fulvivirga ulvae]|uniref:DUF2490 domain-containing protein n=1 Tax=Fulvivirga ulvae TaxID=2904245 RepID=UPI001F1D92AF|nr:DUF2490 domain-containing protein [Fulvivirga ulvae]UII33697.1 DUF2490 domain-containing protein [Fulvivirga ulvae]